VLRDEATGALCPIWLPSALVLLLLLALGSELAHWESVAVETASTIMTMMMKTSCASVFPNSFIARLTSLENLLWKIFCLPVLSNVCASSEMRSPRLRLRKRILCVAKSLAR
jgi:hypothetical protein